MEQSTSSVIEDTLMKSFEQKVDQLWKGQSLYYSYKENTILWLHDHNPIISNESPEQRGVANESLRQKKIFSVLYW